MLRRTLCQPSQPIHVKIIITFLEKNVVWCFFIRSSVSNPCVVCLFLHFGNKVWTLFVLHLPNEQVVHII